MFFSIICPTFNSSLFLEKTLNSLLAQTYKKFEVIFSDDGSHDNTLEILENYRSKFYDIGVNVKIIKNEHNGPGYARNQGLKIAESDWVSFIDSDDLWSSDKLLKVNDFLKINNNYNCILHRQYFLGRNNEIKKYDFDKYFNFKLSVKKQLFRRNFFAMSAVTLKKDLIVNEGGFNEIYQNAQDYDLWIRIGDKFKIFILPEYLGSYCERSDNITSRSYQKRIVNVLKILIKNRKDINFIILIVSILKVLFNKEWFKIFF
tara:strand:+ start:896 stop:1675 length:780 start_codon:yes stop_codon:yes gene_type:complete